jgi:lysophospholipase L1-like esterase
MPGNAWTIARTLGWFALALVIGLLWLDGDLAAIADRLTASREVDGVAPSAGPTFTARPAAVAEADDAESSARQPPPPRGARDKVGALEDVCLQGTPAACKHWAMDGFYRAVADGKRGKLGRAVRVSWFGDSVIATDAIPGRLRARLQDTLGDGGPGFVYAVAPHRFCVHEGVERSASGWTTYAISTTHIADRMYGAGGSTTETYGGRATYKLARSVTGVELYYLEQPKGGTVTVTAGGSELLKVDTAGDRKRPGYATAALGDAATRLELTARGKVRLFGLGLENATGIVVDNLGIVSVHVKSFANQDAAHFALELGHRQPDLVMVMIGANEAAWLQPGDRATREYQAHYEQALAPIRKARSDGACLVVSPTDQAETQGGKYVSRAVMPVLVEAQRKAAHAQGCAFYSTYDWMGGKGSASTWHRKGLVGSDFQHLTRRGANRMADAIYDALMAGYQRYAGN